MGQKIVNLSLIKTATFRKSNALSYLRFGSLDTHEYNSALRIQCPIFTLKKEVHAIAVKCPTRSPTDRYSEVQEFRGDSAAFPRSVQREARMNKGRCRQGVVVNPR